MIDSFNFSLDNFDGPLQLLLLLIQREELDLYDVSLHALTKQAIERFCAENIEEGAEMIALFSSLALMKSQKLLPSEISEGMIPQEDISIEMLQKLIEFCRFRDVANVLAEQEEKQRLFFTRPLQQMPKSIGLGLEEVALDDLKSLFLETLKKSGQKQKTVLQDETWKVESQIQWLKQEILHKQKIAFQSLFSPSMCREQLIARFLALLEMIKNEGIKIILDNNFIFITYDATLQSS